MLKRNIAANIVGSVILAALTVVVTPLQIGFLGLEAYGLIGLMTLLQALAGSCDFGLSATVIQGIAGTHDKENFGSRRLLESIGAIFFLFAVVLAIVFWIASDWVGGFWAASSEIPIDVIGKSIGLMGLCVALRYPVIYFSALLSGMQRMAILNLAKVSSAAFRQLLGVALLFVASDLVLYLCGMALASVIEVITFAFISMRALPNLRWYRLPSLGAFRNVWRFSAGVQVVALSAAVLTQMDRLVISRMLDLRSLGYYTIGYSVMTGISLIHSAINNAALPRLAAHIQESEYWSDEYDRLTAIVSWASSLPCAAVIFFGPEIFSVWIGTEAAAAASMPAAILVAGLLLNALASMPTTVCTALRRPSLVVGVNVIGILIYVPFLVFATNRAGLLGAASAWLLLNCYYVFFGIPLIHRTLNIQRSLRWVCGRLISGPLAAVTLVGLAKAASYSATYSWIFALAAACVAFAVLATLLGNKFLGQGSQ